MRRRKTKVVWLPTTNANSADAGGVNPLICTWQIATFNVPQTTVGDHTAIEIPVTLDGSQSDPLNPVSSLADIENSGYRLRRIVGKVYILLAQSSDDATTSVVGVTAGFMVRRTGQGGIASLASLAPAVAAEAGSELNPGLIDNSMDPWIWRRSWLLADNGTNSTNPFDVTQLPANNYGMQYPGPLEGPHVDQKTARIVGPEERLFLDIGTTCILPRSANQALIVITDLRVLASMRANIGNRRNASR